MQKRQNAILVIVLVIVAIVLYQKKKRMNKEKGTDSEVAAVLHLGKQKETFILSRLNNIDQVHLYHLKNDLYRYQKEKIEALVFSKLHPTPVKLSEDEFLAYLVRVNVQPTYLNDLFFKEQLWKHAEKLKYQEVLNKRLQEATQAKQYQFNLIAPKRPTIKLDVSGLVRLGDQNTEPESSLVLVHAGAYGEANLKKMWRLVKSWQKKYGNRLAVYFLDQPSGVTEGHLERHLLAHCVAKQQPQQYHRVHEALIEGETRDSLLPSLNETIKPCMNEKTSRLEVIEKSNVFQALGDKNPYYLFVNGIYFDYKTDKDLAVVLPAQTSSKEKAVKQL